MITGLVFSIFAIIVAIVGAIVDGISAAIFAGEKGCISTETGSLWGTDEGKVDASECAFGWWLYDRDSKQVATLHATAAAATLQDKDLQAFYNVEYNSPYDNNHSNFFYNHPAWIY